MTELRCTYRLQLGSGLDFARARDLVPYLRDLGVSHLYLSPSLEARAGSPHGYDVVDPTRVSEALGGELGLRELAAQGLPMILDIVPNHMGVGPQNRWWSDPELRERFFDIDPSGGYRRFFDIDDLGALRQEDTGVFDATHEKILGLVRDGVLAGLRVDHPDGLADPPGYLRRLREEGVERVWVEKILMPGEDLRDWAVDGSVGYDFLGDVNALLVDPAAQPTLDSLAAELTGEQSSFASIAHEARLEQAKTTFAREVDRLHRLAPRFGPATLADALARLPIYRTYVEPWSGTVAQADREAIQRSGMDPALARALLLDSGAAAPGELATRFQQTSPAIMAKGVEDTAFYRHLRLLSLNEVGSDPERFSITPSQFHASNLERMRRFPDSLLATSTHDTKRSGDVRARIAALSAMPEEWGERVRRWREINARLRRGEAPDELEEYLIYQTLIGAWPIGAGRLERFLVKALREGKRNSSWARPNEKWERDAVHFARALLEHQPFLADFGPYCERVARAGQRGALAQVLLKLTAPGVPDIYQGDELWSLSLVDPDNRRPVDWAARRRALRRLRAGAGPTPATRKLALIERALTLRRQRPDAFRDAYTPLESSHDGVCAFLRGADVLVVSALRDLDEQAELAVPLAASRWCDVLTGRRVELGATVKLAALLGPDRLALLERAAP